MPGGRGAARLRGEARASNKKESVSAAGFCGLLRWPVRRSFPSGNTHALCTHRGIRAIPSHRDFDAISTVLYRSGLRAVPTEDARAALGEDGGMLSDLPGAAGSGSEARVPASAPPERPPPRELPTVTIEPTPAGWRIVRGPGGECAFATVEDAARAALGGVPACELIVHDAYHRVVRRELVGVAQTQRRSASA